MSEEQLLEAKVINEEIPETKENANFADTRRRIDHKLGNREILIRQARAKLVKNDLILFFYDTHLLHHLIL